MMRKTRLIPKVDTEGWTHWWHLTGCEPPPPPTPIIDESCTLSWCWWGEGGSYNADCYGAYVITKGTITQRLTIWNALNAPKSSFKANKASFGLLEKYVILYNRNLHESDHSSSTDVHTSIVPCFNRLLGLKARGEVDEYSKSTLSCWLQYKKASFYLILKVEYLCNSMINSTPLFSNTLPLTQQVLLLKT